MNSEEIYVIGDVHGCFDTLVALINKLPHKFDSKICFVGDLVDRGARSAEVVELVIRGGFDAVMGNHEFRLLANKHEFFQGGAIADERWFYQNGGRESFASYADKDLKFKERHIEFLANLPLFIEYDEFKIYDAVWDKASGNLSSRIKFKDSARQAKFSAAKSRRLVVSHSAVGRMWQRADLREILKQKPAIFEPRSEECGTLGEDMLNFRRHVLCGRGDTHENRDIFNIYGHTPLPEPFITNFSANIDLGAAYHSRHASKNISNPRLCALAFPSLKIYTQENIDD